MKKFKMKRLFFCAITFALIGSSNANAAIVDADSDGLIEINNLDDLNEIRNNVHGTSLRGNSESCPLDTGCFGYELTRDLDFDSNGNGIVDSGDWNTGTPWISWRSSTHAKLPAGFV